MSVCCHNKCIEVMAFCIFSGVLGGWCCLIASSSLVNIHTAGVSVCCPSMCVGVMAFYIFSGVLGGGGALVLPAI